MEEATEIWTANPGKNHAFGNESIRVRPPFIISSCTVYISWTHIDNGGSGAGFLGHPPARFARRRALKIPGPRTPVIYVCIGPRFIFHLNK